MHRIVASDRLRRSLLCCGASRSALASLQRPGSQALRLWSASAGRPTTNCFALGVLRAPAYSNSSQQRARSAVVGDSLPSPSFRMSSASEEEVAKEPTSSSVTGGSKMPSPAPDAGGGARDSVTSRFRTLLKEYGKVALGTHISLALLSLGSFYAAVRLGVDVGAALRTVGLDLGRGGEEAGSFAVAYTAHKLLTVPRMAVTLTVTPPLAKKLRDAGLLRRPPQPKEASASARFSSESSSSEPSSSESSSSESPGGSCDSADTSDASNSSRNSSTK